MNKFNFRLMTAGALLLLASGTVFAQERLFSGLADEKDVSYVYVSGATIKMLGGSALASGMAGGMIGNFDLSHLKGIEVVNADSKKAASKLSRKCDEIFSKMEIVPLLETSEDDEKAKIFASAISADGVARNIYIISEEPDEYSVIVMLGNIPVGDIVKSMGQAKGKKNTEAVADEEDGKSAPGKCEEGE